MAFAFAKQEVAERGLEDRYELLTGGVEPAEELHPEVVEAMAAVGIDIADRRPSAFKPADARASEYVVTMGCTAGDACPVDWTGKAIAWPLTDTDGNTLEDTAALRDEIARQVSALFDELAQPQ